MVTINATYTGNLHCTASHEPSAATLETDAPKDNQGNGENFSPTDLVATALATCILTTMAIVARRLNVAMEDATVTVTKEMTSTPLRRIAKLTALITMPAGVLPEHRLALEHAAHHCPVAHSLHPDTTLVTTFHWA